MKHALLGLVVHATPSVHETHEPLPLHTWLAPHETPGPLLPKSTHVCIPLVHDVLPVLHGFGFDVQLTSAVHATHVLVGLQTWLVPQPVPAPRGAPSRHVVVPVEQDVVPRKHAAFGLLPQLWPAVHAPQKPLPSHTWAEPHAVPAVLLLPSAQLSIPVAHEVRPLRHVEGLVAHALPAVHATQPPVPLHTRLLPQPVPGGRDMPSTHVCTPVEQLVTPATQSGVGLVPHVRPAVQTAHWPLALHTRLVPHAVPGDFAVPSTQLDAPVAHEVTPLKHALFGFPVHAVPAVHETQPPPPLQTWLVPHVVPGALSLKSTHV